MRLAVATPGRMDYAVAEAWQEALVARRLAGGADMLVLLEHPSVYTLGRGGDPTHLRGAAGGSVPVIRTGRGGQVTWHGPGQLVGYPIVDLRGHRTDVRWYVHALEAALIRSLASLGIAAAGRAGHPGVWVAGGRGERKIASIGVAIRRWVTWHGFALNVAEDLSGFAAITPCGIAGVEMTSVAREGGPDDVAAVLPVVRDAFVAELGYSGWDPIPVPEPGVAAAEPA
jgi:lipoate-protein ligase B